MKRWFEKILNPKELVNFANKHELTPGEILVIEGCKATYDYQTGGSITGSGIRIMYWKEREIPK